jgi:hypothetical protein
VILNIKKKIPLFVGLNQHQAGEE